MPPVAPPPNPSLVAIIFIVHSRQGAQLVFHYPESPESVQLDPRKKGRNGAYTEDGSSSSDSDDDSESTSDDERLSIRTDQHRKWLGDNESLISTFTKRTRQRPADEEDHSSPERKETEKSGWSAPWDSFHGIEARALAAFLSPSNRTWHKRRFEVGLNDLCFLGWPVFVREDGTWQKRRHRKGKKSESGKTEGSEEQPDGDTENTQDTADSTSEQPAPTDEPPSQKVNMTMFNVVFVLNPPVLEYSLRVKEMYENVVKKLGKALKWEQSKSGFVWKEAKIIQKLKDNAREHRVPISTLYKDILEQSSLARAIASIFNSISASKVAGPLMLTPDTQPTFQIPPITSISVLPSLTDPPCLPGLWLTTANSVNDEHLSMNVQSSLSVYLAKHFALLLLDNEQTILKDIAASAGPLAPQLIRYIQSSPPTKSFAKVSARASMSLNDIRQLADHLVYWRRARAIPPLHQRDTYIVSPNADMSNLASACKAYEATFPTLPSLPKMLSALSGYPRQYGTLIPSKDHKDVYFQILSWLLRGGWVTQLRCFAWVRVDKEVKVAVDKAMKEEKRYERKSIMNGTNDAKDGDTDSLRSDSISDTMSIHHRPSLNGGRSFSSSQASISAAAAAAAHSVSSASMPGSLGHKSNSTVDLSTASLIPSPIRASPLESAYLSYIAEHVIPANASLQHLTEEEEAEVKKYFMAFAKSMDGTEAMQKIPIKEGMKRLKVWELLRLMGIGERVLSIDGDVEGDGQTKKTRIVVDVRHW